MNPWHDVRAERVTADRFLALIEISKGSKNKYELDKETGRLILDRVLFTSTHYPQNYGFIPRTYARDLDPLDVLVLCSEAILPMAFVECIPIGVLIMTDSGFPDEKIIAVAANDPVYKDITDVNQVPSHVMEEIRHFFMVYKTLEGKETAVHEIKGVADAKKIINDCLDAYKHSIEPIVFGERNKKSK